MSRSVLRTMSYATSCVRSCGFIRQVSGLHRRFAALFDEASHMTTPSCSKRFQRCRNIRPCSFLPVPSRLAVWEIGTAEQGVVTCPVWTTGTRGVKQQKKKLGLKWATENSGWKTRLLLECHQPSPRNCARDFPGPPCRPRCIFPPSSNRPKHHLTSLWR